MIIYHRTSMLDSAAQTVVNTVNCVGVMGKGLAAEFKARYPDMFTAYKRICDSKLLEPGKLWLWKADDQWVLNFPTKKHWRSPSRIDWIETGLAKFCDHYERLGIEEIAFPKLGCGNGNLDWDLVRPVMERYLDPLPITVFVHDHEYNLGLPEHIEALISGNATLPAPQSSDDVWNAILRASEKVGSEMVDLESKQPFCFSAKNDIVLIESGSDRSFFERDEIDDIWRIFRSGILTKKRLGISDPSESSKLISLFSLMPNARPVPIARPGKEEFEVAVERRPKRGTASEVPNDQLSLSWH